MDDPVERWRDVIDGGLTREVPGELDSDLAARIESRVEREDSGAPAPVARAGVTLALFGAWLALAASLVLLHFRTAPGAYEPLLDTVRAVADGARLDLIAASAAAFLLVEAAARLRD